MVLHGQKLKGEFALVKTHGKAENAWLLFKVKDKYVSTKDVTLQDKSVISKKTLAQIKESSTHLFGENQVNEPAVVKREVATSKRSNLKANIQKEVSSSRRTKSSQESITPGKPAPFPTTLLPMLATRVDKPFDQEGWQYEIKWDGYRTMAFCNNSKVELKSRNDKSFSEKFYPVYTALQDWSIHAVIDGEVVVLDKEGKPNFGALQNWRSPEDGDLYYYVFDLLWINGKDLMQLPLEERRVLLKDMVPERSIIRISENFGAGGNELFETAEKMGLEGIMAKKSNSAYTPGNRSKDWLKIKANKRQEMVIGGYTKNQDSSKAFSSLLLGVYVDKELVYTGKVGTGFTDKEQVEMLKKFKPYITNTPPFSTHPDINKPSRFQPKPVHAAVVWLKPELVCEVRFTEMTAEGVMRHPSFEAMRIDKKANDVTQETIQFTHDMVSMAAVKEKGAVKTTHKDIRTSFLNSGNTSQLMEINGHEVKLTNLSKMYWPHEKITKRDMLTYYHEVAPYILPYLKDRPQSMHRHPDGINGESFYFKDVSGTAPEWAETFDYKSDADDRVRKYLVAKEEASLLYMANLGCIEMNPWHSKVKTEDYPDWCIIDLDPSNNTFQQVIDGKSAQTDPLFPH